MFGITSNFMSAALVVAVGAALVHLFYYFKFKRDVNLSDVDKSLWKLKLFSFFLVALIFAAAVFCPISGFYQAIDLTPSARDAAFQNLVLNQQRMGDQLQQFRDMWSILLIFSGMYLAGVATFVGRLQREKQTHASLDDPKIKRPLGLDLD